MFASARRAYESGTKSAPSGRELEAAALFKAARQLEQCRQEWNAPERDQHLEEALRYNQRLWTFFQSEWMAENCPIPAALRANLLRLSNYVDRRTFEIMSRPSPESLKVLIDINREIATGLSTPVQAAEPGSRAA
jgi:flagellar protein FlaF